jgi:hypothetical protein
MNKRNFGVRLDEALVSRLGTIADTYGISTARVIEQALRIYTGLVEQNGGAMLSPGQIADFTNVITGELRTSTISEDTPEKKIIVPSSDDGGVKT